jgi:hypothetical protein
MNPRQLVLLSPFKVPAQSPLVLAADDMAAFLSGYSALWHPAALAGAAGPPRVESSYDHEQPIAGHIYAVPENPPIFLPDDWERRVREAGAVSFRAGSDRAATIANLLEGMREAWGVARGARSVEDGETPHASPGISQEFTLNQVRPFLAIGFGYVHVNALFEAMEHDNLIPAADFWQDVQQAVAALSDADPEAFRRFLQSAADRLYEARQVLYPVTIHVVDLCLLQEDRLNEPLPAAYDWNMPMNLVAASAVLERLGREHPDRLAAVRGRIADDKVEVCGGSYLEREDALLPVESQLWNLVKGLSVARELLGTDIRVFGRRRFGFHPQMPLLLSSVGLVRALMLTFDDGALPSFQATVVTWPSPDGRQVDAFTRTPHAADSANTYFHVAHFLHKTIMQDHAATLALLHTGSAAAPWYEDWLELTRLAPVLGQWTTLTNYFNEVMAGEHAPASSADDYHVDYLTERTEAKLAHPVSGFARHLRQRRLIDTLWTLAAIHRGLRGALDPLRLEDRLTRLEDQIEERGMCGVECETTPRAEELAEAQQQVMEALGERLLGRAQEDMPGYLIVNPCSFTRRVALELDGAGAPLSVTGPLKACQIDGAELRLVVEVPALGFAWVPRSGAANTPLMATRLRLADARHVRNEFFEAEIDPATGGLRGLWDHRTRMNRLGQQLVFNPGSTMRASAVKVVSTGPALGEVISEGAILGDQQQVLAKFRQRFRAWLGRPMLELRLEIYPEHAAEGYPWHSYFGARLAWRDERAMLLRSVTGTGYITTHTRPQTPDYLELRQGRQNTVIFPGGLPFHQRHGARMLDIILVPVGETGQAFELGLSLDREHPMQTALGMVTPVPVVAVAKGPPHIGASGWLFHLDSPNLLLTSMRPGAGGADAVTARLLECGGHGGSAELRCVRDPGRALLQDARGENQREFDVQGDTVHLDVSAGDWAQVRVEFSEKGEGLGAALPQ